MHGKHGYGYEDLVAQREEKNRMILERAPWITENNWILPLEGEDPVEMHYIRNLGMLEKIRMQQAVTFNQMQQHFWTDRFTELSYHEARAQCKALGLEFKKGNREVMQARLIDYFTNLVSGTRV